MTSSSEMGDSKVGASTEETSFSPVYKFISKALIWENSAVNTSTFLAKGSSLYRLPAEAPVAPVSLRLVADLRGGGGGVSSDSPKSPSTIAILEVFLSQDITLQFMQASSVRPCFRCSKPKQEGQQSCPSSFCRVAKHNVQAWDTISILAQIKFL